MIVSSHVDAGSRPMNFRDPVVSVSVEVTVFVTVPAFPGMLGIRTQHLHAHVAGTLPTNPSHHLCYFYF